MNSSGNVKKNLVPRYKGEERLLLPLRMVTEIKLEDLKKEVLRELGNAHWCFDLLNKFIS